MKEQLWKFKLVVLIVLSVISNIIFFQLEVNAKDVTISTVRLLIGDGTNARHHMELSIDEVSDEFHYEVKGYEVKSCSYSSSNPEAFTIQDTSEGRCRIKAVSQGTGFVTLIIHTKEGKKLTEKVFVSVCESISVCEAVTKKKADVYRGASDNTDVENDDKKGELRKGEWITIIAVCDDYFRFMRKEENIEPDGYYTGFVKISDVNIPVTSISVEEELFFDMGEEGELDVEVEPELASEQKFIYSSSNTSIASIDENGLIKTRKAGITEITVSTADGTHKAQCIVYVYSSDDVAWEDSGEEKEDREGNSSIQGSSKKTKNKFNFQANGYTDKSIRLTWDKQKKVKNYEIQRAAKKRGKYKTIKKLKAGKKKYLDKNVKFYKNYWYRLVVVKKNKKRLQSNPVKARTKDSIVNMDLHVADVKENSVKLEWKKQKHATRYIIQRRDVWARKEAFENIGEVGKKETGFVDQTVESANKYEYRIKVEKTNNKDKISNIVVARTLFQYDNDINISKFQKDYPFVCIDEKQDINQYSVFQDYFSPIKYSYANGTLTIHLYCEFVQYIPQGGDYERKVICSPSDEKNSKYYNSFQEGVKERYEIAIANRGNQEYEFQNMDFDIKFVFHEKENKKEKYHEAQVFNEILLGGECPDFIEYGVLFKCKYSKQGNHWYHEHESPNKKGESIARIYMPYLDQLEDNIDINSRYYGFGDYEYISAHEMGHAVGLNDGYPTEEKYDRFADNEETGVPESRFLGSYDNIMVERVWNKYLMPNDLEMMFQAYMDSEGKSWNHLQSYKTNEDARITISDCILNHDDHYNDTEGRAY